MLLILQFALYSASTLSNLQGELLELVVGLMTTFHTVFLTYRALEMKPNWQTVCLALFLHLFVDAVML